MQYATANKLTYTAIEELLKLLQILCPCPNGLPTTLYKFKKFFQQHSSGFEQRVCCKCFASLDKVETCTTCIDPDNLVHNPEMPGLLVHIPFQKPLQTILSSKFLCYPLPSPSLSFLSLLSLPSLLTHSISLSSLFSFSLSLSVTWVLY